MFYVLRFTPCDISGYDLEGFLGNVQGKWIYNSEISQKGVLHYHVLFESELSDPTERKAIVKYLRIPKGQKGIGNKFYSLKIADPHTLKYVTKEGYKAQQGYNEMELDDINKNKQEPTLIASEAPVSGPRGEEKKNNDEKNTHKSMWPQMRLESEDAPDFKTRSLRSWIVWIQGRALRQGGPLLRNADAYRYAQSLHIIYTTNALQNEEKLERLLNEHADHIMAQNEKI